jgi:hypothetical protein
MYLHRFFLVKIVDMYKLIRTLPKSLIEPKREKEKVSGLCYLLVQGAYPIL